MAKRLILESPESIMHYFDSEILISDSDRERITEQFQYFAKNLLMIELFDGPEVVHLLRKLVEAKDAAIRCIEDNNRNTEREARLDAARKLLDDVKADETQDVVLHIPFTD